MAESSQNWWGKVTQILRLPLSTAHLGAGTVEFACTSPKYLRNNFIETHPRNCDPINRAVYDENVAAVSNFL